MADNMPLNNKPSTLALLLVYITISAFSSGILAAEPTSGNSLNTSNNFNIRPQPLSSALLEFSQAAKVKIFYDAHITKGIDSPGLSGRYAAGVALRKLLEKTHISYSLTPSGSIKLQAPEDNGADARLLPVAQPTAKANDSETTLEKVTVEADASYDPDWAKDPYNPDYVLPNATSGTKTDTPIMETPLNVQVISKQVLKDQQVIRLDQALRNISGVTTNNISNSGGLIGTSIHLRGFDTQAFFRNGFRLEDGSASREFANVESVEVMKGPAAILYGRIEPGGMINVTTKQPLATPYYSLNQQFGSFDLYRTTVDASGPLTKNDTLLYRMNLSYENSGSFREFLFKDNIFLAPIVTWNISSKTKATLEMEYGHNTYNPDNNWLPSFNGKLIKAPFSRNYGEPDTSTQETIFVGFNWSHQFNDDWMVKHRFSANKVDSQEGTIQPSIAVTPGLVQQNRQLFVSQTDTYSTNIDLIGHFDTAWLKHTLLLGGDYYRRDYSRPDLLFGIQNTFINIFNPVHTGGSFSSTPGGGNEKTITDNYGLYIQDQIKLPYNIHVMGGIRYQNFHQRDTSTFYKPQDLSNQSQDAVTPRVGLLWQPQDWLSFYANYAESFGANTGRMFPGKTPPPSSAEQYEIGVKSEFFDKRLRTTLAFFDLTKTNVTVGDPDPKHNCGGGPASCVLVAGEAQSKGVELDIQGEILPGWNVIATYSNTDVRLTKGGIGFLGLNAGDRFTGIPRNTGSVWSTYEFQQAALRGFKIGGGVNLQDSQLVLAPTPNNRTLAGFATVGLMAGYSFEMGKSKVTAQFNVDNLLDKRYFTSLAGPFASTGFGDTYVTFSNPRTFMGSISVQY